MTVAFSERKSGPYTATAGQAVFNYGWRLIEADDLKVMRRRDGVSMTLVLGLDYSVSGVGNPSGGTITLTSGALVGDQFVLFGDRAPERTATFAGFRSVPNSAINDEHDRIEIELQEVRRDVGRAIKSSPFSGVGLQFADPEPGKLLGYSSDGSTVIPVASDLAEVAADVAAAQAAATASGNGASASHSSADASAVSASNSAASAVVAAAARDAATVNAGVYIDIATGLAAVSDGQQFIVVSADGFEAVRYRRDSVSTYTKLAAYPTRSYVDLRYVTMPDQERLIETADIPLVADASGRVVVRVNPESGQAIFGNAKFDVASFGGGSAYALDADFTPLAFAWLDAGGNIVASITKAGEFLAGPASTGKVEIDREPYDYNHVVSNGQSLSVRTGVFLPVVDANDKTFSGGVDLRTSETGNTLVSMASDNSAVILWNAVQQAKALMAGWVSQRDPAFNNDFPYLISSHGVSGQTIAQLAKGGSSGAYEAMMFGVAEGVRLAASAGKTHGVNALIWLQGESDNTLSVAAYKAAFLAYLTTFRAEVAAATGQTVPPIILTYQPSGQQYDRTIGSTVSNNVAQSYYELSEADANVVIASPTYWVPHEDQLHPTAYGSMLLGCMFGKALYRAAFRGEKWRPLEPIKATKISNRIITIKYRVPVGHLVIDPTTVSDPGSYGFVVEDAGGTKTITEVKVVGGSTIRITVSTDLAASPTVAYAFYGVGGNGGGPITGARGCVRDSDKTIGLHGREMPNWSVAYKLNIPYARV